MIKLQAERDYWNTSARDVDVDRKYISDIAIGPCLEAIGPLHKPTLEIGCGVGRLMTDGDYGIDISENMIEIAKQRKPRCHFAVTNGSKIPYKNDKFGSVYSMLVFQHNDEHTVKRYMQEAYRVLGRGGTFRFQYVEGNYHNFVHHQYTYDEMSGWLRDCGFQIKAIDHKLVHDQWTWITAVKP